MNSGYLTLGLRQIYFFGNLGVTTRGGLFIPHATTRPSLSRCRLALPSSGFGISIAIPHAKSTTGNIIICIAFGNLS